MPLFPDIGLVKAPSILDELFSHCTLRWYWLENLSKEKSIYSCNKIQINLAVKVDCVGDRAVIEGAGSEREEERLQ